MALLIKIRILVLLFELCRVKNKQILLDDLCNLSCRVGESPMVTVQNLNFASFQIW